jgi:hypothetical protein
LVLDIGKKEAAARAEDALQIRKDVTFAVLG